MAISEQTRVATASTVAVVLAGGLGTRIRHVLGGVPKPLAMVAGRPFLEWVLRYLDAQGLRLPRTADNAESELALVLSRGDEYDLGQLAGFVVGELAIVRWLKSERPRLANPNRLIPSRSK